MNMPVVYVAGPFRSSTPWGIECNVRRAEEVALIVWRMGAAALCPHTNTRFFDGAAPGELFVEGTLELMRRCDAVVVLANYDSSKGTKGEIAEAVRLGKDVFYDFESLQAWIGEYMRKQVDPLQVVESVAAEGYDGNGSPTSAQPQADGAGA